MKQHPLTNSAIMDSAAKRQRTGSYDWKMTPIPLKGSDGKGISKGGASLGPGAVRTKAGSQPPPAAQRIPARPPQHQQAPLSKAGGGPKGPVGPSGNRPALGPTHAQSKTEYTASERLKNAQTAANAARNRASAAVSPATPIVKRPGQTLHKPHFSGKMPEKIQTAAPIGKSTSPALPKVSTTNYAAKAGLKKGQTIDAPVTKASGNSQNSAPTVAKAKAKAPEAGKAGLKGGNLKGKGKGKDVSAMRTAGAPRACRCGNLVAEKYWQAMESKETYCNECWEKIQARNTSNPQLGILLGLEAMRDLGVQLSIAV